MSKLFPEKPVLFYPSIAERYGTDEAILLSLLNEQFHCLSVGARSPGDKTIARGASSHNSNAHHVESRSPGEPGVVGARSPGDDGLLLPPGHWQVLTPFWSEAHFYLTLDSLEDQALLHVERGQGGTLKIQRQRVAEQPIQSNQPAPPSEQASSPAPVARSLPVYDTPPPASAPAAAKGRQRGPAPVFGGTSGWRRHKDELEQIFDWHEERNQRLIPMTMGWAPGPAFHDMLSRQGIPEAFSSQCLDEFVLYWLDKDRKETNWDQKFLGWVKREWVKKQSRDAAPRANEQQPSGQLNENTRRDTRENRKRVTAAIMDIKDTDW
ncbi:DnaT-like ssDNA-binding domain-containing protein [Nitrincola sp.]|uniref:DnaT-like ssDNA-binding domain-containing protein n=1 Tax=Nitrincola sp. TaxID=1926584 RepID=UPI003A8D2235